MIHYSRGKQFSKNTSESTRVKREEDIKGFKTECDFRERHTCIRSHYVTFFTFKYKDGGTFQTLRRERTQFDRHYTLLS